MVSPETVMWQDQAVRLPRRSEKTLYSGDERWRWEQWARQLILEAGPHLVWRKNWLGE